MHIESECCVTILCHILCHFSYSLFELLMGTTSKTESEYETDVNDQSFLRTKNPTCDSSILMVLFVVTYRPSFLDCRMNEIQTVQTNFITAFGRFWCRHSEVEIWFSNFANGWRFKFLELKDIFDSKCFKFLIKKKYY